MRTRRGLCYPRVNTTTTTTTTTKTLNNKKSKINSSTRPSRTAALHKALDAFTSRLPPLNHFNEVNSIRNTISDATPPSRKRAKVSHDQYSCSENGGFDFFDGLPDDLVVCILAKLSSSATCPADFANVLITCKRLNGLGLNSIVLSKASPKTFAIKPVNWSDSAHKFLKLCSDAGNVEASYTLGMIRFYCLHSRGSGASLMAKAAINSHAQALYSLAVIQFNGSGGTKSDKDLRAGVALCARAAFLGHVDALRELGHCLQDGYGVRQNVSEGRRFLVQANARELASALSHDPSKSCRSTTSCSSRAATSASKNGVTSGMGCPLLSDFGCNVPAPEAHPANRFLTEWYAGRVIIGSGLRLCSHAECGRLETRKHEFRRCSVCGAVNYCSRACQALDWKLRHKVECAPMPRWINGNFNDDGEINEMDVDEEGRS